MSDSRFQYIVARVVDNAKDCIEEFKDNKGEFFDGKMLAYYEVLDTIKNELMVDNVDLKEFGLDIDLDKVFISKDID